MGKPILYLDMDGVIVDLFGYAADITGVTDTKELSQEQFDKFFAGHDAEELFADLPKFDSADKLVSIISQLAGSFNILSSPLAEDKDGSIRGKNRWLDKNIVIMPAKRIFDHEKYKYAKQSDGTPNILIDDYKFNINKWREAGGIAIRYRADRMDPDDIIAELKIALDNGGNETISERLARRWYAVKSAVTESDAEMKLSPESKLLDEVELSETLKRVKGKWALVSKSNPKKVLQYYRGGDERPSKEWVNRVERRVHSFGEAAESNNISDIVTAYLNSDIGKKYEKYDCKTVTRAFANWAKENNIPVKVLSLAPPSAEVIKQRPELKGRSGEGDGHIMPVVNGNAIDFTARQFPGVSGHPYNNPLITPISQVKQVYQKIGGYFTDTPEWFLGGKSYYLGPWESIPASIMKMDFGDETLPEGLDETRQGAWEWLKGYLPNWPEYVLRDWIYRGVTKPSPGDNPKDVVDRILTSEGMSPDTKWKFFPSFNFTFDKLHPDTQRRIREREFGKTNPYSVPKDAERHATQSDLSKKQGGVSKEPVIGKLTPNGFELIEGWHRTMQHLRRFPSGYGGPAWVAMDANATESINEMGGVGVVATNPKMARDPRYSTSMTVDIGPGETQKQAKKMGFSTDKLGIPPKLDPSGAVPRKKPPK